MSCHYYKVVAQPEVALRGPLGPMLPRRAHLRNLQKTSPPAARPMASTMSSVPPSAPSGRGVPYPAPPPRSSTCHARTLRHTAARHARDVAAAGLPRKGHRLRLMQCDTR